MGLLDYSFNRTSPLVDASFGTATTNNSKSTSGIIQSVVVTNINSAIRYFQLYNGTSTSGTPIINIPIPAGASSNSPGSIILDTVFFGDGLLFPQGITWAISTANGSYSAATASDHTLNLTYL